MTVKAFLHILKRSGETHVVMSEDGDPIAAILPFDRYQELLGERHIRSHAGSGRRTVPIPESVPASVSSEPVDELQGADEPHFQFEPLPEEEDLTHG